MTAQTPEKLIYEGSELALCSEPLALFPGVERVEAPYFAPSTALWRGYVGTWAIESDRLYLKSLRRAKRVAGQGVNVGIEDLFPGFPDGVFAHWYTGELRCPRGALLDYVHGGYFSVYEEDLFFRVQRGVVVEERIVRNGTASLASEVGYVLGAATNVGLGD
jgi:hypothetical protein